MYYLAIFCVTRLLWNLCNVNQCKSISPISCFQFRVGPAWRSTWTASHTPWLWTGSRPVAHKATSAPSRAATARWPTTPQSPSWESASWSVDSITQWKWCPIMEPVSVYPQCCLSGKVSNYLRNAVCIFDLLIFITCCISLYCVSVPFSCLFFFLELWKKKLLFLLQYHVCPLMWWWAVTVARVSHKWHGSRVLVPCPIKCVQRIETACARIAIPTRRRAD